MSLNESISYHLIISGIISGMILFQTSIIAPTVFKTLEADQVRIFLRNIFPKLFRVLFLTGIISIIILIIFKSNNKIQYSVSLISIIFPFICYKIIPITNKAKDDGNEKIFSVLHRISVLSIMIVLIINLFWIIFI
tara:strand:+ start:3600 stop:4007 length:408 start_codon:yes stop_codon:yes gene_type:complete